MWLINRFIRGRKVKMAVLIKSLGVFVVRHVIASAFQEGLAYYNSSYLSSFLSLFNDTVSTDYLI